MHGHKERNKESQGEKAERKTVVWSPRRTEPGKYYGRQLIRSSKVCNADRLSANITLVDIAIEATIDTGASRSFISDFLLERSPQLQGLQQPTSLQVKMAEGTPYDIKYFITTNLQLKSRCCIINLLV